MARIIRTLSVLSALLLVSCDTPFGLGDDTDDDLRANEARWDRNGYDSYDVVVRRLCFCGFVDSVRVFVRDGEKVGQEVAGTGEPVPFQQEYPDVPGLFDVVWDALDRHADDIDVRYHSQLGYPVEISIDYDRNAIDEEVTWLVTSIVER